MTDYKNGLMHGMVMTDDEALRFCNGMIAAVNGDPKLHIDTLYRYQLDYKAARSIIPAMMDVLADYGMTATIGYKGTPIISELVTFDSDMVASAPEKEACKHCGRVI